MEVSSELQESQKLSPNSHSSSSSCSSNGVRQSSPSTPPKHSHTHKAKAGADPTTFIQADTASFKQLVQMLTGSSQTMKHATPSRSPTKSSIPPIRSIPKKAGHKLYERRNSFKSLKVSPLVSGLVENCGFSPREMEMLSPSMLDFPSLVISPVTPLSLEPFSRSPISTSKLSEQRRVTDSGFYLDYSSSSSTPRDSEPRLLPLFPVTSPKISGAEGF